MTCLCDIELYKALMEEDQLEIEEIDNSFHETLDIMLHVDDEDSEIEINMLFPQPTDKII